MQARAAGITALIGALVLAGGYVYADAAGMVPGVFTFDPPLPKVAPFPHPHSVSLQAPPVAQFKPAAEINPGFLRGLTQEFVTDYRMKDVKVSWWIGTMEGRELASENPDLALTPASTTKLFTASAVLQQFGSAARPRTLVAWNGATRRLYLIGGGDILLGTGLDSPREVFGYAGLQSLAQRTVDALGSRTKNALTQGPYTLVVDTSWFGGETFSTRWRPQDRQWVAPIQGLAIDTGLAQRNRPGYVSDPARVAGNAFAQALGASAAPPARVETGKSPLAKTEILDPSQPLPPLGQPGMSPNETAIVALSQGAPFAQIIRQMLKYSDNSLAETLGRLIALHRHETPTFAAAGKAVQQSVAELGIRLGKTQLVGCSGLAHDTHIPARVLAELVRITTLPENPQLHAVTANLPVAGGDGTLATVYRNTTATGNLRGKTGTLAIANSLAGTLVYHNQVLTYGLIISGYPEGNPGQTIALKQMFLAGILGGKTNFSPVDPTDPTNADATSSPKNPTPTTNR